MKPHLRSLRELQSVWAIVEEPMAREEILINFNGDLVRVSNQTGRQFRPGQRVLLQIQSLKPLKMKLVTRGRSSRNLDVTI